MRGVSLNPRKPRKWAESLSDKPNSSTVHFLIRVKAVRHMVSIVSTPMNGRSRDMLQRTVENISNGGEHISLPATIWTSQEGYLIRANGINAIQVDCDVPRRFY